MLAVKLATRRKLNTSLAWALRYAGINSRKEYVSPASKTVVYSISTSAHALSEKVALPSNSSRTQTNNEGNIVAPGLIAIIADASRPIKFFLPRKNKKCHTELQYYYYTALIAQLLNMQSTLRTKTRNAFTAQLKPVLWEFESCMTVGSFAANLHAVLPDHCKCAYGTPTVWSIP